MVILLTLFLAEEYWTTIFPNNANYKNPSRYWNSWFSVTRGLGSSILVSAENLKLVEINWQNKLLLLSSLQKTYSPKYAKRALIFVLPRQSKSSLTPTTAFISSTKFAIKKFSLLRSIKASNYHLRYLQLTSGSPKKSRSFFQYGVFSIFKTRFPHNY